MAAFFAVKILNYVRRAVQVLESLPENLGGVNHIYKRRRVHLGHLFAQAYHFAAAHNHLDDVAAGA